MRIACHDYNWLPYAFTHHLTLDLEGVLAEVADAGYEAVEFSRHPMELDDPARTARLLERFGLELTGMSLTYRDQPGCFDQMKENARIIADLGGEYAVWFSIVDWEAGIVNDSVDFPDVVAVSDAFAEFAGTLGVDTVIHNHLGTDLETPEDLDHILPRLERCGLCLDTGHLIAAGGDPAATARKYPDLVRHVHFKDWLSTLSDGKGDFVELGEGDDPARLEASLEALREIGFDGWLVLEQDRTRTTPLDSARRNFSWLKAHGV